MAKIYYCGITDNFQAAAFYLHTVRQGHRCLSRRSQRSDILWEKFEVILARHPLLRPTLLHSLYVPRPPDPETLVGFSCKQFPGARISSAYEAGFSGFSLHRTLGRHEIYNIVVQPAAIEVAARDRGKTDKRDSAKIAEQLAAGRLQGIRVPTEEEERKRLRTRGREQLLRHRTRLQNQLRMWLHHFGLLAPTDARRRSSEVVAEVFHRPLSPELRLTVETLYTMWQGIDEQLRQLGVQLRLQAKQDPLE